MLTCAHLCVSVRKCVYFLDCLSIFIWAPHSLSLIQHTSLTVCFFLPDHLRLTTCRQSPPHSLPPSSSLTTFDSTPPPNTFIRSFLFLLHLSAPTSPHTAYPCPLYPNFEFGLVSSCALLPVSTSLCVLWVYALLCVWWGVKEMGGREEYSVQGG